MEKANQSVTEILIILLIIHIDLYLRNEAMSRGQKVSYRDNEGQDIVLP